MIDNGGDGEGTCAVLITWQMDALVRSQTPLSARCGLSPCA